MGKKFVRTAYTEAEVGEILKTGIGTEQIVYFETDRGPHLVAVRLKNPKKKRQTFGPRPTGDLLNLAIDRALTNGAILHLVRLLHLTDPTDIGTLTAVASEVDVAQNVAGSSDEYVFSINELGPAGDNFSVVIAAGTLANTFKATLTSTEADIADEVYDNLSVDSDIGADYFVTRLNTNNAGRLRATDTTPEPAPTYPDELPVNGTYPLIGGSNGTVLNDASIIGDPAAGTGFYAANNALQNPNVLAAHQNISSAPAVVAGGLAYGELADVVMFQEPPDQADTDDAIDFRNGTGVYVHSAFDSSYGVLTYARPQVFDVAQGVNVLVPTVGELAPMLVRAHNRNLGGAFWLAPAGGQRGGITADVLGLSDDVGVPTRKDEADNLVGANYNPFVTSSGSLRHWGNQTLTIDETSLLVNLHVRFLLIGLRRILKAAFDKSAFEPNSPKSWKALFLRANPILERLQAQGAMANFRYLGDQNATRADDQDQLEINDVADIALGIYTVELWIQPFSAIDNEINVNMKVTSTAINFEELFAEAA